MIAGIAMTTAACGGAAEQSKLVDEISRGVLEIRDDSDGLGTGFIVDQRKGFVLTAAHVVAGLDNVKVRYGDQVQSAQIYGEDPCNDLALLRSDPLPPGMRALSFSTSPVEAGQPVMVLGYPATLQRSARRHAKLVSTFGAVTVDGTIEAAPDGSSGRYTSVIQHQAPTTGGDSGGPVVDSSGRVVGMEVFHNEDAPNQGYAISSHYITRHLPKLEQGKFIAYVGIFVEPPRLRTREDVRDMNWKIKTPKKGVAVYISDPGSPAQRHNFYYGDYIHDVNRRVVNSMEELCDILQAHEGEEIRIAGREVDSGRPYVEYVTVDDSGPPRQP
jgi:serine protease Do